MMTGKPQKYHEGNEIRAGETHQFNIQPKLDIEEQADLIQFTFKQTLVKQGFFRYKKAGHCPAFCVQQNYMFSIMT